MSDQSIVYLIHFQVPYVGRIQHYIGTAKDLDQRLEEHRKTHWSRYAQPKTLDDGRRKLGDLSGSGALILGVANAVGISWEVVRTWKGGRRLERQLKNHHKAWRHCPKCNPHMRKDNGKLKEKPHANANTQ